jgi:branched-chain amino acid transport system ATP-binding protein
MALAISDYAFVISEGRINLQGSSRELIHNEQVRQAYLGIAEGH